MRSRIALPAVVMNCSDVLLRLDDLKHAGGYQGVFGWCGKYGQVIFGHRCLGIFLFGYLWSISLHLVGFECLAMYRHDRFLGLESFQSSFRGLVARMLKSFTPGVAPSLQKTLYQACRDATLLKVTDNWTPRSSISPIFFFTGVLAVGAHMTGRGQCDSSFVSKVFLKLAISANQMSALLQCILPQNKRQASAAIKHLHVPMSLP